jgi:hypothetical protein
MEFFRRVNECIAFLGGDCRRVTQKFAGKAETGGRITEDPIIGEAF